MTADKATADWWYALDQRVHACIRMWLEGEWWGQQCHHMTETLGEVLATERQKSQAVIAKFTERLIRVEAASNFEERVAKLAGEIKRGQELPQSELLARIDALQRQLDELRKVAAQPGPPGPAALHDSTESDLLIIDLSKSVVATAQATNRAFGRFRLPKHPPLSNANSQVMTPPNSFD
jgi:hypothetical protein